MQPGRKTASGKAVTFQGETLGTEGRAGKGRDNPISEPRALLTQTAASQKQVLGALDTGTLYSLGISGLIYFLREESLTNRRFSSKWICFVKFCLSKLCL